MPPLIDTVKAKDPDRYRSALLAKRDISSALLTFYAFHYELARIPEYVSESMIGAIRYQWWREAVDEIYTGKPVRKHEVSTPLAAVLLDFKVSRFWIDGLIDGRERDLDPRPFANIEDAREYCLATSGKLIQIAAQITAPSLRLTPQQTDGLNAAGLAWGLTGLARAYGFYQKGMLSGLDFDDITAAASLAMQQARSGLNSVPSELMPALAYLALVPKFLNKMRSPFDPINDKALLSPLGKQMTMMGTVMKGRF